MGKTERVITGWVVTGLFAAGVFAEESVGKKEFDALQKEGAALKSELTEPQVKMPEPARPGLPEGLEFGALIEVEAAYSRTKSDSESDLTLATVELSAGWQLTDWLRGDLVFLYEENDTEPMELDQAFVTLGDTERFPLFLQAGKLYVPFGNFDTFFITDPVVLELGETREKAATLGFEKGGFLAGWTVFNGDVETRGGSEIENMVLSASYGVEGENSALRFGAAWIRNIMDSDALTDVLKDDLGYAFTSERTGGVNTWLTASYGPATLIAEYVKTLDQIRVDGAGIGLKPESLNLELGYALTDRLDVAAKFEKSREVSDWFPEKRYGLACGFQLAEIKTYCIRCSLEYMREDFGSGAEDANVVTVQLAFGF